MMPWVVKSIHAMYAKLERNKMVLTEETADMKNAKGDTREKLLCGFVS